MIRNFVICLAVTSFPYFDCKVTNIITTTENPNQNLVVTINNATTSHNETLPLQKNSSIIAQKNNTIIAQKNNTIIAQKNETDVKNDNLDTNRKPKTREASADVPVLSTSTVSDDMDAQQSFYPSALMVYPFPMLNTYYPRYFPYTYNPGYAGYQGYPFYG